VDILDPVLPGRDVSYVYMADPVGFDDDAETFVTKTGLPESCYDVITYGAAARLMAGVDAAREVKKQTSWSYCPKGKVWVVWTGEDSQSMRAECIKR
jgi:hypothetical protein